MVRVEIQLFLENVPGQLGRLADMLAREGINIDDLTIQDASASVKELFRARGKSLKWIDPAASYGSMQKDSADFALIRLLVNDTDRAIALLSEGGYLFDMTPVIALELDNRPGTLSEMARKFGEEGINIHYVYGSAMGSQEKSLFVFCPEDVEAAARIFKGGG